MADEEKRKRQQEREEERERLLRQIERGLAEIQKEMRNFSETYTRFVQSGGEIDDRLASWTRFFNEISLVSEERNTGRTSS
jgi:hypothetical protein